MIHPSLKCFENVVLVKSLNKLEKELQKSNVCGTSSDLESGKLPLSPQKLNVHGPNGCDEMKRHEVVLNLSAIAFCLRGLVMETRDVEKGLMDLLQWENPTSHVNLYEISSKIDALCNN
ncbi:hypothetical protein CTI12_AA465450 [Artemisia annua]|uniref:Uncharacterized protein n=1 Tax=Artemisia annua TaxID=35608 RepID=A0A2U1LQ40_ARTAN|nr:hypothetical protein CTI12_AA465450 [Artemisia annua]